LSRSTLDIDHMFPWTAWLCSDLWNLLPAHREVNQRLKRDRLPSATTSFRAEGRIIGWWEKAYLGRAESYLAEQFLQEARASLPAFSTDAAGDIFASVCLQRLRLRMTSRCRNGRAGHKLVTWRVDDPRLRVG
jgi:hypothetical protein